MIKTADGNTLGQLAPAILPDQLGQNHFERNAMQGVIRLKIRHCSFVFLYTLDRFFGGVCWAFIHGYKKILAQKKTATGNVD